MVIDIFSKYGWIAPLKDKKTESVSKAFNEIFQKNKRKPTMLWTDKGSEFISKHFKEFLKKEKIKLYHTENGEKSSVVERWNRTMKNGMWKMFTANNNTVHWDKIDKLVDDYNNTKHSSIKMTPNEASKKENEEKVFVNLHGDLMYWIPKKPKFSIGDKVRISKYKRRVFDKGYTPNWTEEIFVVDKILPTSIDQVVFYAYFVFFVANLHFLVLYIKRTSIFVFLGFVPFSFFVLCLPFSFVSFFYFLYSLFPFFVYRIPFFVFFYFFFYFLYLLFFFFFVILLYCFSFSFFSV